MTETTRKRIVASRQTMTAAEYRAEIEAPKPSKYRNRRTVYRSIQGFERTYDSKKEADFAANLDHQLRAGLIGWWLPQPSFPLPGGVTYRADFLIMNMVLRIPQFYDVKGGARDTQASINKRKQVKDLFGIDVEIVK